MTDARRKEEFHRKLKGAPIGHDAFGRPILEGDLLLFAAKRGTDSEMRVIKVVETLRDDGYGANKDKVKFRIKRAERGWCSPRKWELQERTSMIQRIDETFLLEDPPQFIIDLFEEDTDGE